MSVTEPPPAYALGEVFQIDQGYEQPGSVGAFVIATEIKAWGIHGYVRTPKRGRG